MKKIVVLLVSLTGLAGLSSCRDSTEVTEHMVVSGEYIAGTVRSEDGKFKPACWINEVLVDLPFDAPEGYATGVDLSGDKLFICGYESFPVGGGSNTYVPLYWENGVRHQIGDQNATVEAIQLLGENIYAAGTMYDVASGRKSAVWWKNGQLNRLSQGTNPSEATGILADSLDVYVCGKEVVSEITRARLWKNGLLVNLDANEGHSEAAGVTREGEDIYVFGSFTPFVYPYTSLPVYWKNGKRIELDLPTGASAASVTDLTFMGDKMFVTGYFYSGLKYEACFWENGMFKKMNADSHAEARGISAFRNRIRVIGNLHHGAGVVWENTQITMQKQGARFNKILYK